MIVAIGGVLVTIGGGIRWIAGRVEAQVKAAAEKEKDARDELSRMLYAEIEALKATVKELRDENRTAAKREQLYMNRILTLEQHIIQQGQTLPLTNGWPPA